MASSADSTNHTKQQASPPVYELCPLVSRNSFDGGNRGSNGEISCVQAFGRNIYVGTSTGMMMRYSLENIDGSLQYVLVSAIQHQTKTEIAALQVAPTTQKAIILSDGKVWFYSLPAFEPIPINILRPMGGALNFCINETLQDQEPVGLALVKRTGLAFWELGTRLNYQKEINISPIVTLRRAGPSYCIADTENYIIIDLATMSQYAIHPISLSQTYKILPIIEVCGRDEYLIVACTFASDDLMTINAMGLFINGRGEPSRAPIEWNSMPLSVCVHQIREGGDNVSYVVSLHVDQFGTGEAKLEVRRPDVPSFLQVIPLSPTDLEGRVRLISLSREGFSAPVQDSKQVLQATNFLLFELPVNGDAERSTEGRRQGTNGDTREGVVTPPPTPKASSTSNQRQHSRSQSRNSLINQPSASDGSSDQLLSSLSANIVLATSSSLHTLLPPTFSARVEKLLSDGKVNAAEKLVRGIKPGQARKGEEDLALTIAYLNLRIGLLYLHQTSFEAAGDALFRGELDPRILISLWDEWRDVVRRASVKSSSPPLSQSDQKEDSKQDRDQLPAQVEVEIFSGLEPQLRELRKTTVSEIVAYSLVRNYSPHLKPSTALSSTGQELRATLEWNAREMLKKYLRKWRVRRGFETNTNANANGNANKATADFRHRVWTNDSINRAVDTTSVLLYATFGDAEEQEELRDLLDKSPHLLWEDVRKVLESNKHFSLLATQFERREEEESLCDLYVKIADGTWADPSITNPVERVRKLLQETKDRKLVKKHVMWLLRRDEDAAMKLLIYSQSKRSSPSDDAALLSQIQDVSPRAATAFLEHLVLYKQSIDPSLHTRLVTSYLDTLLHALLDDTSNKLLEGQLMLIENYRMSSELHSSTPFLAHVAFGLPDSSIKAVRLKLALMLQGSAFYHMREVTSKIEPLNKDIKMTLAYERAIIQARNGNHKETLSILVNELLDSTTAETYCSLGGERVIAPKIASAIGERLGLRPWAALVLNGNFPTSNSLGAPSWLRRQASGHSNHSNQSDNSGDRSPSGETSSGNSGKVMALTKMLLEVYMKAGDAKVTEASRLLNAQAVNLDTEDIMTLVPASWSLSLMSSFLSRSFRRSLHYQYEGQILKQLSAGQNLQTSEFAFECFAAEGAIIQESTEQDEGSGPPPDFEAFEQGSADLEEDKNLASTSIPKEKELVIQIGEKAVRRQDNGLPSRGKEEPAPPRPVAKEI